MRSTVLCILVLIVLAPACASGGTAVTPETDRGAPTVGASKRRSSRSVLTAEEIATAQVSTAYEAVERLRPEFLRTHGTMSTQEMTTPIVVYLDNVRAGTVDALRRIEARDVEAIRYVNSKDATTRYGTGHGGGVLEVTSKGSKR